MQTSELDARRSNRDTFIRVVYGCTINSMPTFRVYVEGTEYVHEKRARLRATAEEKDVAILEDGKGPK